MVCDVALKNGMLYGLCMRLFGPLCRPASVIVWLEIRIGCVNPYVLVAWGVCAGFGALLDAALVGWLTGRVRTKRAFGFYVS